MTPIRHIVDELRESLAQSIDDPRITKAQVAYWVVLIGNRLKMQHIAKRDSGAHLHVYAGLPLDKYGGTTNPNKVEGRWYFKLPAQIFDYDLDGGISYISYFPADDDPICPPRFTKTKVFRTTPAKAERLYWNPYERPSPKTPYFYRVDDHIYFLGLEQVNIDQIEVGLYSTLPPVTEIDLDAPLDFPEETLAILQRQVLDLGRFALMAPQDYINEGRNELGNANVPSNKLSSVEDMRNEEGQQSNEQ